MEMERGSAASKRKIETQIMHFNGLQWGAYSYKWNDAGTDAELVGPKGEEIDLQVKDASAPRGARRQTWKIFSRAECLRCHTIWNNFTPGFTGAQLHRDVLETFDLRPDPQPLADPYGHEAAEWKARSYLHVNCSVCHREAGGGAVRSFMNFDRPLRDSRLIDQKPVAGALGLPEARVIAPGDPTRSVLLYRMTTAGRGHMPYLGGKLIDDAGVLAVRTWVVGMKPDEPLPASVARQMNDEALWGKELAGGNLEVLSKLLESASGALRVAHALIDGSIKGESRAVVIEKGSALPDPLKRDLFERFLAPEKRRKVLGAHFASEELLGMKGDATHGKEMFAAICATCHRADGVGADFGPDLSKIAAKWNRAGLLEQISQPGKVIEPQWNVTTVTTPDGDSFAGFIVSRNDSGITLKIPGGERKEIPAKDIKSVTTAKATLMPDGLLENLSAQEAADLLEFLSARK
jgi:putative heme-binding domain-containing protein